MDKAVRTSLLAGAIEPHDEGMLQRRVFKDCNPGVKMLVESAIWTARCSRFSVMDAWTTRIRRRRAGAPLRNRV